jgi:NAD(P)H-hydrate epimerase
VTPADLLPLIVRASVIAIGPGLSATPWATGLLAAVLDTDQPLVIDADGLNLLATDPVRRDSWILTPHPGEAARLLRTDVASIQQDRFQAVRSLQAEYGGVCVLKGAGSLIAGDPALPVWLCDAGNPGMASGGMGDVLTGIIAGLVAQGLSLLDAASLGVWLHASAGDQAARDGARGTLALDLLPHLRRLGNPADA